MQFIPRNWVLQQIIDKVQKEGDREVLKGVMKMVAKPFEEEWGWDAELEERWCKAPPREGRGLKCSCSS